jgi:hypothetical protein
MSARDSTEELLRGEAHPLIRKILHRNPGDWEFETCIQVAINRREEHVFWFTSSYRLRRKQPRHVWPICIELRDVRNMQVGDRIECGMRAAESEVLSLLESKVAELSATEGMDHDFRGALTVVLNYARHVHHHVIEHNAEALWLGPYLEQLQK